MAKAVLIDGNEAIGRGAIDGGCKGYFGYPITPQNEIPEFMSREMPKAGGIFVQSECETASINMVYGGTLAGERVMTSTSSPGFSLMQEGISIIAETEMPAVIAHVMRMGPGQGTGGQQGQTDYRQLAKGGGHGGYRNIVIAASSAQECYDFMQLAFYLADKYRMLVIMVADFVIGRSAEPVELRRLEFPDDLPEKTWAMKGKGKKGGARFFYVTAAIAHGGQPFAYHKKMADHYQKVKENEVRYETYMDADAELLLVSFGSTARLSRKAVDLARAEGRKWGLFRPITLWPFPEEQLRETAWRIGKVVSVEDTAGELVEDVESVVQGRVPVKLVPMWARHTPPGMMAGGSGLLYPERILEEVRSMKW
jgi:2-oxoglutarate ferredoxin oxidoreductase subunit alpha